MSLRLETWYVATAGGPGSMRLRLVNAAGREVAFPQALLRYVVAVAGVALVQNIGGTGATVVSHVLTRED